MPVTGYHGLQGFLGQGVLYKNMFGCRLHFCLVIVFFIAGGLSASVFGETYIINGNPEKKGPKTRAVTSNIRNESLIIKDTRLYIRVVVDVGTRHLGDFQDGRLKETLYRLPKDLVYDEVSKRIFYYKDDSEIEIGREKSFLGFMPYIALAEGVKIMSSPTDAKLLVSLNRNDQEAPVAGIHAEEGMDETLTEKCGQCHILEYIFSHEEWLEEDILHAFNRIQMNRETFTEDNQKIIDQFKEFQKGAIDEGHLAEFKVLKEIAETDVIDFTKGVYKSSCVPCHDTSNISDVSALYTKRRCKSVIERMKEKEPSLFLQADTDRLASYLWEIKLRPKREVFD